MKTKLKLNGEYAKRHFFFVVLMAGLGGWFGYDGLVKYPATPAADLYREIEKSDPPASVDVEAFKRQKTQSQYGFAFLALLAALAVGGRLWKAWKFDFAFDEDVFENGGKTFSYADVTKVDRALWEKKGIIVVNGIKLDSWHHSGVKEFVEILDKRLAAVKAEAAK